MNEQLTPDEFAAKIKAKYPQYNGVDNATLAQKMVAKYPQYAAQVNFGTPEKKPGILSQAASAVGDIFNKGAQAVSADISRSADKQSAIQGSSFGAELQRTGNAINSGIQTAGDVAGTAGNLLAAPVSAGVNKVSDILSNLGAVQKFAKDPVVSHLLDGIDKGIMTADQAHQVLQKNHPELAKNLESFGNIASLLIGEKPVQSVAEGSAQGAISVVKATPGAVGTITSKTAEGIANSGVGKKVSSVTTNFANDLTKKSVDNLENTYTDLFSGTRTGSRAVARSEASTAAKNAAGTTGQTPQRILAESGIIPKQEGSRLSTLQQAEDFRASIDPLHKVNRAALQEVSQATQPISLDSVEQEALKQARTPANINAGTAEDLVKEIQSEFANLRSHYGESVPITTLDDIKSARWGKVKFDSTRPYRGDANYQIAKAAQKSIETEASNAGFHDVAQLNRHIGDRLEAAKFLESLDQKSLRGGKLGRYVLQAVGSTLGHTIPGKIAGALGGDMVANLLISNSVAGPVKRIILKNLQRENPAAYNSALKWLEQQNVLKISRPLLPAGKPGTNPIPMGGKDSALRNIDASGKLIYP